MMTPKKISNTMKNIKKVTAELGKLVQANSMDDELKKLLPGDKWISIIPDMFGNLAGPIQRNIIAAMTRNQNGANAFYNAVEEILGHENATNLIAGYTKGK